MTAIEKLKQWVATFPGFDILSQFRVDYTDQTPANAGIFPSGLVEISRTEDILGSITVINQYNFGIYYVFEKAPGDDAGAMVNADWVMEFQHWVQEQSIQHLAPFFGNIETDRETIKAQNGVLYSQNNEGTAMYMVQLAVQFKNYYEVI